MLRREFLDERCSADAPRRVHEPYIKLQDALREPCSPQDDGKYLESQKNEQPEDDAAMVNALRKRLDDKQLPAPYFPQPNDHLSVNPVGSVEPVGPWATGRPVFSPTAGVTGLRPVVDRYSMTRYSPAEWRRHNKQFFDDSSEIIANSRQLAADVRQNNARIYKSADRNQQENRDKLSTRSGEVHQLQSELQQALLEITDEIELLEGERRRVKQSLSVLTVPESIAGEFLQLRSTRLEPDLVRDRVEDELVKVHQEVALCAETRRMLVSTREAIEDQLLEAKTAKTRLEFDLTDKIDAYKIDSACVALTNDSPLVLMRAGATRVPPDQSSPEGYQQFTREVLDACFEARKKSVDLRASLDATYLKTVKYLRSQAIQVDLALAEQVNITEQVCQEMEKELTKCLQELAETEQFIEELRGASKGLHDAIKVAQTRLDHRHERRNVENCRDPPQYGLIEEVRVLNDNLAVIARELKQAEEAQTRLVKSRRNLEREIIVKRKTLYVDRDRGQQLRSFYPSAEALSGRL